MLNTMRYGTYIFFAAFCAIGGLFVYFLVPETKNKTLEELDVYFGGAEDGIAAADQERMRRINESLGLGHLEQVGDLDTKAPVLGSAELSEKAA